MPQKAERKREYMRGYMASKRQAMRKTLPKKVSQGGTNNRKQTPTSNKRESVSPFSERIFSWWDIGDGRPTKGLAGLHPMKRRHLPAYMTYLAERGGTLQGLSVETGEVLEAVDKGARVIYRLVPLLPLYQQTPTTRTIRDAPTERIVAVERWVTQHEAEHILRQAQEEAYERR